ncbi:MAG: asparagine synthase (glutamine-hydrolyzing), partial [Phycisphaerae bacterium]
MCGIAGFVGFQDDGLLRRMCSSLEHRGPDEAGYFSAPGVGLAMRRLAVIDLTSGHQPIGNETGEVQVVFNGEIYNYQELTARLKAGGHRFTTTSDTETLVHLYEDHGLDFVHRLRGMFAIALWDAPRRRLVLVRDRIGEKPLFFAESPGRLLFGSEIKAILQAPLARAADAQAVCEFLASGYVPAPRTFFRGIRKLGPGQMLVHENGGARIIDYWSPGPRVESALPFEAAAEELAGRLDETVRLCLKSDVEVGAFLSGGIDSSALVALMRRHEARVQTFSVGYRGAAAGFNELGYARRVAGELGTDHHELIIGAGPTMALLPRIIWHYDEPHGEPTSVLVYLLCEFTRRRVKVAVGGTGGDEIFYGYPRHAGIRMLEYYLRLPRLLRERLVERVVARWPESTRGHRFVKRAKRFISGSRLPPAEAYLNWVSLLQPDVRQELIADALRREAPDPSGEACLRRYLTGADGLLLNQAADLDIGGYLPEYQLAYMDRMSMAHGLEVRSPLCDYDLVGFVRSLPASYRLKRLRSKHIFKTIATRWIPQEIACRRKIGFDSPIGQWAKDEMRPFLLRFLSPEHVARTGVLNPAGVQAILADHLAGRRDYSLPIWSLMALECWYRLYIENGASGAGDSRLESLRGADGAAPPSAGRVNGAPRSTEATTHQVVRMKRAFSCKNLWESVPPRARGWIGRLAEPLPPAWVLGGGFRRHLTFARQTDRWSEDQARAYQLEALRSLCRLAYERTPFYRRLFDGVGFRPGDLKAVEDLSGLPTISRTEIQTHLGDMCASSPLSPRVDAVSTGGTGGAPLSFFIGTDRSAVEFAHLVASWERIGYRLGTALAVFRGHIVPPDRTGLRHFYDPILRQHCYSSFHLTDQDAQRYLRHLATVGPCFLHVYPSSATALARFIQRSGCPAPANLLGVIAESEILCPHQRELVEATFGCRCFSCYGHSEKLILAAECEHTADYHVWPGYGYFELLDEEARAVDVP